MIPWDLRPQIRKAVDAGLPEPEVRATATSRFTVETIDAALRKLHGLDDAESVRQREYLLALRHRKFGE